MATLAFGLLAGTAPAGAAILTEDLTGFFGPATTLGGVALGADTAFTLQAMADTSSAFAFRPGLDSYAITSLMITVDGKGTFVGIPDADTNIFLADLTLDPNEHFYQAGIVNSMFSGGFGGAFSTASPGFDAASPTSSALSGFLKFTIIPSYHIALVGVAGGLVVNDMGSGEQSASILVGVPEPSSLALVGLGTVGLAWRLRRREKAAN